MSFKTRDYHEVEATLWSALPERLRRSGRRSAWADANRVGEPADSFLEGPCFDAQDHLVLVDIPFDCILRVSPAGEWQVVAEYDGWPNGLQVLPDGDDLVTDYRRGLLRIAAGTGKLSEQLATRYSESFRGLNDLHLARNGTSTSLTRARPACTTRPAASIA